MEKHFYPKCEAENCPNEGTNIMSNGLVSDVWLCAEHRKKNA